MKNYLFLAFIFPLFLFAQDADVSALDNLMNKKWSAEGNWNNGAKFNKTLHFPTNSNGH